MSPVISSDTVGTFLEALFNFVEYLLNLHCSSEVPLCVLSASITHIVTHCQQSQPLDHRQQKLGGLLMTKQANIMYKHRIFYAKL